MSATADALSYKADVPSRLRESIGGRLEDARDTITRTAQSVAENVGAVAANVGRATPNLSGAASDMTDNVSDAANKMGTTVSQVAGGVRERVATTTDGLKRNAGTLAQTIRENPLGLALGGFAVGVAVGLVLPATDFEREHLAPLADRVKDDMLDKGQAFIERSRDAVVEAAVSTMGKPESGGQVYSSQRDSSNEEMAGSGSTGTYGGT
ncbi:MAG TPA: hypothetical protein VME66_13290 [Candidatus Acidoferrales bacterium]|nr:hypothetical protein [Candidatus Acidoferrales bacterium]